MCFSFNTLLTNINYHQNKTLIWEMLSPKAFATIENTDKSKNKFL